MTVSDIASVVRDADWLAHRYDPEHDAVHFVHVPRATHDRVTFLTDEYLPAGLEPFIARREDAVALAGQPAPVHYIFHSAFCCSTLLARAFDLPGVAMGLKEPVILNDLAGWRTRGTGKPADIARALDHSLRLLARPFAPGEATIVKPSNVTLGLARAMMAMRPDANALLLFAPLETYLKSVAKKDMDGRLWVRDLLVKLLHDGLVDLGFEVDDYLRLTDLQTAAVGWLAQHALFAQLAREFPGRVATLDSETLLARPADTIQALSRLFQLGLSDSGVADIAQGKAFSRHSKFGQTFGATDRDAEYAAAAQAHGDEIGKVAVWATAVAANAEVAMTLPPALLG